MSEQSVNDWFQKSGFDEDGNGLDKWLGKTREQPDHSYLDDLITLQKLFPDMQVLYVLNVLNSTPEANMQAIRYLMQHGVHVVGVEAGNEVYGKYATFSEYVHDFEPIFKLLDAEYPQIKKGLVAGANTGRSMIAKWNQDLSAYRGDYDAVILHYYYTKQQLNDTYDLLDKKSAYEAGKSDSKLDKAFKKAAEQLMSGTLLEDGIHYAHEQFQGKEIWITEWNTKPSDMLNNTIVNGAWQFKEMVELRDQTNYLLIHNGVSPDKYGMISRSTKFDDTQNNMAKRMGYYAYILASEVQNGVSVTKCMDMKVVPNGNGTAYLYFENMGAVGPLTLDYGKYKVESASMHFVSGKYLYSSSGTTGFMGKGTKPNYEVQGIQVQDFKGELPANSFGYILIRLK